MSPARAESGGSVVAFIDLGTYSLRLLVVRLNPNQSYTILIDEKEPVRLGGDEFERNRLTEEAMERAVLVCARFADMARGFSAKELIAVATSATREAENQREFVDKLREEADIELSVVSGREEARLIYLGVSRGLHLNGDTALFLDIGGGSTEVAIGDDKDYAYLDSMKLGTIRVTQMFELDQHEKPVTTEQYAQLVNYARNSGVRSVQQLSRYSFQTVVGSSGTARNLAGIAAANLQKNPAEGDPTLTRDELRQVREMLCAAPLADRRKIAGLNPERADVIISGAAILEMLMDELKIDKLQTSRRGLRDGLLVQYLERTQHADSLAGMSARRRSVHLLGRQCGYDEAHGKNVARLALQLFDSAAELGLHKFGAWERELLEYAGMLHDLGVFLSFVNHQAHTYYLIRHADLVGFDQTEIGIIAALARYHRKGSPRKKAEETRELTKRGERVVNKLYVLMRLAERLERSHQGVVTAARFKRIDSKSVALEVETDGDATLELWAVGKDSKHFMKAFDHRLVVVSD